MENKLTTRLEVAKKYFYLDSIILDVGADKGLLVKDLSKNVKRIYASENKIGPYKILKDNTKDCKNIITLFSDGLNDLPIDVDYVSILGMGGETIYKIFSKNLNRLDQIENILIEPQTTFEKPIKLLLDNGYINDGGTYIFEKHYYPILRFKKASKNIKYSSAEYKFGPYPLNNKDEKLYNYLNLKKTKLLEIQNLYHNIDSNELNVVLEGLKYYE